MPGREDESCVPSPQSSQLGLAKEPRRATLPGHSHTTSPFPGVDGSFLASCLWSSPLQEPRAETAGDGQGWGWDPEQNNYRTLLEMKPSRASHSPAECRSYNFLLLFLFSNHPGRVLWWLGDCSRVGLGLRGSTLATQTHPDPLFGQPPHPPILAPTRPFSILPPHTCSSAQGLPSLLVHTHSPSLAHPGSSWESSTGIAPCPSPFILLSITLPIWQPWARARDKYSSDQDWHGLCPLELGPLTFMSCASHMLCPRLE